jgi:Uma2 family endonuclease
MSAATLASAKQAAPTEPAPYRFSVAQYLKLAGQEFFGSESKVELINGLVVEKMTRYAPHDGTLALLYAWFVRHLPRAWVPRCQLGLVLALSVPEPAIAVVRGPEETYQRRQPRAADAGLLVEVAESSLEYDRQVKGPLYAEARIAEYWIVNVLDLQVEVYTQPRGGKSPGYRQRTDYARRAAVPLVLDGQASGKLALTGLFAGLMRQ